MIEIKKKEKQKNIESMRSKIQEIRDSKFRMKYIIYNIFSITVNFRDNFK